MKRRYSIPIVLLGACLSFCVSACADTQFVDVPVVVEDDVTSLDLSTSELSLKVNEEGMIQAFVTAANIKTVNINWRSSNLAVAKVEGSKSGTNFFGKVLGRSSGEAIITAVAGLKQARCKVYVGTGGSIVSVESITLSSTEKRVTAGESFTLTAQVLPTNATNKTVTWTSSDNSVATVNQGVVNTLKEGSAVITASAGGKSASCKVFVNRQGTTPDEISIYLDKTSLSLTEGDQAQLNASASESLTIVWSSSDSAIASVSQTGYVKAIAPGQAVITATITKGELNATASCIVNVSKKQAASDYEAQFPAKNMASPLHLYIHYKREKNDYDNWAVWIWQKVPEDLEGSLWGATKKELLETVDIVPMTDHWMLNSETGGTGDDPYCDEYGQVIDIDLSNPNIISGRDHTSSPLIPEYGSETWSKARLGFLIVDQTQMNGGSHWTSDGGIEAYIKNLDKKLPTSESYLHIYCQEGSVASFTYSSGETAAPNPTALDETGQYSSKNNITDLKRDLYPNGVSTSERFLADEPGVGYQIFVPSFADGDGDGSGDIRGIINKLDYLDDLGVKCLWLTPIQESGSYHGYDVTDYYKVDPKFGTIQDYQELIFKAHQRGMKVLMDMVINHTSKSNVLFTKSQRAETETINGKTINYRDMYLWKFKGEKIRKWDGVVPADKQTPATYINVSVDDEVVEDWYRDGSSNYYYYGKFGSGMAELNYSYQGTRDYMTDMCKYWLSFGLDGFRLDAVKHIYLESEIDPDVAAKYSNDYISYDVSYRDYYDNEKMEMVHAENDYSYDRDLNVAFWKEFAGTIKAAYPNCFLVGENFDGWNQRIAPFYNALDSQFDFSTYYHLNEMGPSAIGDDVMKTLDINNGVRSDHINGAFTSNHDIPRLLNHAASTTLTVHSQEVNSSNSDIAIKRAKYYAALTILSPGLSWIYYGDELGMSGNQQDNVQYDEDGNKVPDDHGNNIDRWYRQPMRWSTKRGVDGVPKYRLMGLEVLWDNYNVNLPTASEQANQSGSMLKHFQELGRIKALPEYPTYGCILWGGSIDGDDNTCSFEITDGHTNVIIFINNTATARAVPGHNSGTKLGGSVGSTQTSVAPYGFLVLKR